MLSWVSINFKVCLKFLVEVVIGVLSDELNIVIIISRISLRSFIKLHTYSLSSWEFHCLTYCIVSFIVRMRSLKYSLVWIVNSFNKWWESIFQNWNLLRFLSVLIWILSLEFLKQSANLNNLRIKQNTYSELFLAWFKVKRGQINNKESELYCQFIRSFSKKIFGNFKNFRNKCEYPLF